MASGSGTYYAAKLLNQTFNATVYVFPTSLDLRLFSTGGLTPAGAGTEVAGAGYQPFQAQCNVTNWPVTTTNSIANGVVFSFNPAGGAWTVAITLGIYEHGNNNLVCFGDLLAPKTLSSGDVFQFTQGNVTITQS